MGDKKKEEEYCCYPDSNKPKMLFNKSNKVKQHYHNPFSEKLLEKNDENANLGISSLKNEREIRKRGNFSLSRGSPPEFNNFLVKREKEKNITEIAQSGEKELNEYLKDPDFLILYPSRRLLEIFRNEFRKKANTIDLWNGRVTDAELERQLGLASGYIKRIKAKIRNGKEHTYDFTTLEKFYKHTKSKLNDGGFVTILAIKNYLQNFSSVYILLFNILIQFSTFLQRYISLRELSRLIHGKHGTYLQNFLTGIDSQTGNRLNGIFLHSVLHILHDIFRIQKLRNLNQKNLKNLKNRCYYVVFNWLVSEGKVYDGHSMEREFQIIFDIIHLLSLEKGEFFGPAQLSLILTDDRNKQLLTTKLIQGTRFDRSQINSLKFIISRYFLSNQLSITIYKKLNAYLMKYEYKSFNYDYNPKFNDPEVVAEHFYILMIEQIGLDCLTLKPLLDSYRHPLFGWVRHHIDEDIRSIDPNKLALIQSNIHSSSVLLPHLRDRGATKRDVFYTRAKILYNRKIIRELLFMDKKILKRKDLPDEFINNFQTDSDIKEFLNRRNKLRILGDSLFFDNEIGIYKNFYLSNKYEPFWNSHEINYIK